MASLMTGAAPPARAQTASTTQEQQRKTSTPYSGDMSFFDYPDRDKKLHVNQMMDLLGILPGKSVADIGAGWDGSRYARLSG